MKKFLSLIAILALTLTFTLHAAASLTDWLPTVRETQTGEQIESDGSGNPENSSSEDPEKSDGTEADDKKEDNPLETIDSGMFGIESNPSGQTEDETVSFPIEIPSAPDILKPDEQPQRIVEEDSDESFPKWLIPVIGGAVLLIIIIIIIAVAASRKKQPVGIIPAGSEVSIEVLSGRCYNTIFGFTLDQEIRIGTDADCQLVFEDDAMLPVHAVISRSADGVVISDCAEAGSTYVGGMKIFAPNRLRSGDVVTVAGSTFRVMF